MGIWKTAALVVGFGLIGVASSAEGKEPVEAPVYIAEFSEEEGSELHPVELELEAEEIVVNVEEIEMEPEVIVARPMGKARAQGGKSATPRL
jgi:hypothetical protein